jgi:transcriptional regulator with XRE-family HTH domain
MVRSRAIAWHHSGFGMSTALMKSIGRAARQARRARKLTQEDVADRLGVSAQFYGRIERGYALPSVTTLRRMLEVLDLKADELFGGDPPAETFGHDAAASAPGQDMNGPALRRLARYLRRASSVTLEVITVVLDELDRAGELLRGRGQASATGEPRPGEPGEDGEPDAPDEDSDLDDSDLDEEGELDEPGDEPGDEIDEPDEP